MPGPKVELGNAPIQASGQQAKVNSRYMTVDLPSQFAVYPFDELQVRTFDLLDLKKVYKASKSGDLKAIAEVMDNCISPEISIYDLTIGDFYYLMYWQRLNSYNKNPWTIRFTCQGEEHQTAVQVWEQATLQERIQHAEWVEQGQKPLMHHSDTLNQVTIFGKQMLKQTQLDAEAFSKFLTDTQKEYGILMYPQTLADTIEHVDHMQALAKRDADKLARENMQHMAKNKGQPMAQKDTIEGAIGALIKSQSDYLDEDWWLNIVTKISRQHGIRLLDRSRWLEEAVKEGKVSNDFLMAVGEFDAVSNHGVQEFIDCKCEVCGHISRVEVSVDAHDFFPSV